MGLFGKTKSSSVTFANPSEEFRYWYERSKNPDGECVHDVLFSSRLSWGSATDLVAALLRSYERDLSLLDANVSDTCIEFESLVGEPDFDLFKLIEAAGISRVDSADEYTLVLFFVIGQAIRKLGYEGLTKSQWTRANDRAVITKLRSILREWGFEATGGYGLQWEFQRTPLEFRTGSFRDFLRAHGK
jgi:hypothetical protein